MDSVAAWQDPDRLVQAVGNTLRSLEQNRDNPDQCRAQINGYVVDETLVGNLCNSGRLYMDVQGASQARCTTPVPANTAQASTDTRNMLCVWTGSGGRQASVIAAAHFQDGNPVVQQLSWANG